ncbi:hypothetical protein T484DRAFT_1754854 [Baffinella frigidus]|nr:hypothetical protein T484DRAFT_1754854 [Cryptophyta sp. CCMP2293]
MGEGGLHHRLTDHVMDAINLQMRNLSIPMTVGMPVGPRRVPARIPPSTSPGIMSSTGQIRRIPTGFSGNRRSLPTVGRHNDVAGYRHRGGVRGGGGGSSGRDRSEDVRGGGGGSSGRDRSEDVRGGGGGSSGRDRSEDVRGSRGGSSALDRSLSLQHRNGGSAYAGTSDEEPVVSVRDARRQKDASRELAKLFGSSQLHDAARIKPYMHDLEALCESITGSMADDLRIAVYDKNQYHFHGLVMSVVDPCEARELFVR